MSKFYTEKAILPKGNQTESQDIFMLSGVKPVLEVLRENSSSVDAVYIRKGQLSLLFDCPFIGYADKLYR